MSTIRSESGVNIDDEVFQEVFDEDRLLYEDEDDDDDEEGGGGGGRLMDERTVADLESLFLAPDALRMDSQGEAFTISTPHRQP